MMSQLPIQISVRATFPQRGNYDWYGALALYEQVGAVEVAFYRPELFLQGVTVEKVLAPFSTLSLRVTSVHMAQARIARFDEFLAVLRKTIPIAQALGCPIIVVHPTSARLAQVESKIVGVVDPLLAQAGVTLCWETFAGRRRFLSGIEGIAAFCRGRERHAACYDTSHLHKPQPEVLADVANYADCIRCFHLSNRGPAGTQQHLPLRHREGVLDFEGIIAAIAESGFSGPLTLEYLPQFHDRLVRDARWAQDVLSRIQVEDY
ncbi:MAG TPA: sugar phosphate isomerase/epimerase [Chloroflexi bacterium]|nr:sugar phosphate isomerase/epimerase [Chloroflexota bacterium]